MMNVLWPQESPTSTAIIRVGIQGKGEQSRFYANTYAYGSVRPAPSISLSLFVRTEIRILTAVRQTYDNNVSIYTVKMRL